MNKLIISATHNNGSTRCFTIRPGQKITFGSHRNSLIRLHTEAAVICYDQSGFTFSDSSRHVIDPDRVDIENWVFTFRIKKQKPLFDNPTQQNTNQTNSLLQRKHHRILIKKNGHLLETCFLNESEPFQVPYSDKQSIFPKDGHIQTVQRESFTYESQIVSSPKDEESYRGVISKKTKTIISILFLGIICSALLLPSKSDSENRPKSIENNRFTKVLFDQKELEQAIHQSNEVLSKNFNTVAEPLTGGDQTEVTSATEVIDSLKNANVAKMISSIIAESDSIIKGTENLKKKTTNSKSPHSSLNSRLKPKSMHSKESSFSASRKIANLTKTLNNGTKKYSLSKGQIGKSEIKVVEQETLIKGGLEPEVIAKVIKQHIGEVRYCYERQLNKNTELKGKVNLNFAIAANGSVSWQKIKDSTLKNDLVEGCILRRVAKWKFPNPKGGTSVNVVYPFLFQSIN